MRWRGGGHPAGKVENGRQRSASCQDCPADWQRILEIIVLKARRIPLGLLYVAILILVVITIPLAQFARRQPINHRQSPAFSARLNQMKM
jgi:hypothetical protein